MMVQTKRKTLTNLSGCKPYLTNFRKSRNIFAEIRQTARVEFQTSILNPDGSVFKVNPWRKNLIVDSGLDMLGVRAWVECFQNCKAGNSTTPTQRDSSTITVTITGTAAVASAGFFVSGDVGRLLKADSGEERYISAFIDAQNVTLATGATVTAEEFTIWYVNDTTLGNQLKQTSTYGSDTGDNGSTFLTDTWTHKRTFIFGAEVGSVTYREVGWGHDSGTAIFGRAVLPGGGDTLSAGQQYKIVVRLIVTYSPVTGTPIGDVGNNGFDTTGDESIERNDQNQQVNSSGNSTGGVAGLDPSYAGGLRSTVIITTSFTLGSMAGGQGAGGNAFAQVGTLNASYSAGTFLLDTTSEFPVGTGNSTAIKGIGIYNAFNGQRIFTVKFDSDQTKDSNHKLIVTWRFSWQRTLVN